MAEFILNPPAPFRLDLTVWVLRRVAVNRVDQWNGKAWRRVMMVNETPVRVEVSQQGTARAPELLVRTGGQWTKSRQQALASQIGKMLGLQVDLKPFERLAQPHPKLSELIRPFRGFRPPRLGSVFETLLNGISCQQISIVAGLQVLNRLVEAYGPAAEDQHAFPQPQDLVSAHVDDLRLLGFSTRKAETILNTARAMTEGGLDLENLSQLDDEAAMATLVNLKGIGRWTAHYILLRGLGRLNVFPIDDIGGMNKMQQWLELAERPDAKKMEQLLAPWRPYQGLLYFYLLMEHQRAAGLHEIHR
jgi:DNA-3-methyladenine glycosylase II